eukprot:scaffold1954_cov268-Pinguiococcus_pyrenoidosus.AAC.202
MACSKALKIVWSSRSRSRCDIPTTLPAAQKHRKSLQGRMEHHFRRPMATETVSLSSWLSSSCRTISELLSSSRTSPAERHFAEPAVAHVASRGALHRSFGNTAPPRAEMASSNSSTRAATCSCPASESFPHAFEVRRETVDMLETSAFGGKVTPSSESVCLRRYGYHLSRAHASSASRLIAAERSARGRRCVVRARSSAAAPERAFWRALFGSADPRA